MNRKEIKARAKETFKANYGTHVVTNLLYGLLIGVAGGTLIGIILLGGPLSVGMMNFHKKAAHKENEEVTDMFSGFNNFENSVVGYLLTCLFIFLWSLLFIIPGIIMSFAYAMVPYLLNKDHNLKGSDALKLSKQMMKGHKWQLFVLGLSFIGWILLDALTFGILGILYVAPYQAQSFYNFYEEVDKEYNGTNTQEAKVVE